MLTSRQEMIYSLLPNGISISEEMWREAYSSQVDSRAFNNAIFSFEVQALLRQGFVFYDASEVDVNGLRICVFNYKRSRNDLDKNCNGPIEN